jgi:hypothetical protein
MILTEDFYKATMLGHMEELMVVDNSLEVMEANIIRLNFREPRHLLRWVKKQICLVKDKAKLEQQEKFKNS